MIPEDIRNANIVTLYKNKGDRRDCNNYRGILQLSIVGKAFARVLLKRLQLLADGIYPESQCGFRANRSTVDMIFSLRQLQEKCRSREQRQPLFIACINLTVIQTVHQWNLLPPSIASMASLPFFKACMDSYSP